MPGPPWSPIFEHRAIHWLTIFLAFFPAMAALLPHRPFGNTMEDLTVLTAQEMVRTGQWAVPTLWGEVRIAKPPLAHWVCAAGVALGSCLGAGQSATMN